MWLNSVDTFKTSQQLKEYCSRVVRVLGKVNVLKYSNYEAS